MNILTHLYNTQFTPAFILCRLYYSESIRWRSGLRIDLQVGMSQVPFPMVSLTISFRLHYDPEIASASNRNEFQGYILGVKADGS